MNRKYIPLGLTSSMKTTAVKDTKSKQPIKISSADNYLGLVYVENKFSLIEKLPLTLESYEHTEKISGTEARERFNKWCNENTEEAKKFKHLVFDDTKSYTITDIKLRVWNHVQGMKKIKNQKHLDTYIAWLKRNNDLIKEQYPQLVKEKLTELNVEDFG